MGGGAQLDARLDETLAGGRRRDELVATLLPGVVAGGLALLAIALRWRGSDLPAHFFRVGLVERDGFGVWNNHWFGGHHTLGYGVLFPVLGATVGIWTVAVVSAAGSALVVDRLIIGAVGHRRIWASLWFAAATVTNVAIGRLPFALGMLVGLGALLAAQRRQMVVAVVLTALTSAASPVVSSFLAIVFTAWALVSSGHERRRNMWLTVAAVVPVLVVALVYPQGGTFPFRWSALVVTLAVCASVAALVPAEQRLVRAVAGVYALAAVATFLVPSPVGANITRFGAYAAAPVVLAVGFAHRRRAAALLAVVAFWQWSPAFDAIVRAGNDPSTEAAYYRPLLDFFAGAGADAASGRVEIVPTARHWEAAFVALELPIARGWERQLDMRFNPAFYVPGLDATDLHTWLVDRGVRYVALPDVPLDTSGRAEAQLLIDGVDGLRPAWRSEHWRVWEVVGADGLVDATQADVVDVSSDRVTLDVRRRGDLLVRLRASAFWSADPPRCVEPTVQEWIVVRDAQVGRLVLTLEATDFVTLDEPCDPPPP